jgi:RNA polymerase subunit RPABC4/transcription elongation factor Spt4
MAICPYCKDIVPEPEATLCPACNASHHRECWEANQGTCSVYGCESKAEGALMGCPFCEEVYTPGRRTCAICGEPLMDSRGFADFLERYEWQRLTTEEEWNPVLAAGYLRNNGIVARLSKKAPVSMFGVSGKVTVWVPTDQARDAVALMENLSHRFRSCPACGHALFIDEEECSYCTDSPGAES